MSEQAVADVVELPVVKTEPEPVVEDHAPNAIGWTPELTARFKWVLAHAKDFEALVLEIDREVGSFTTGIVALAAGEYEKAALCLWNAGMIEKSPSAVEEVEES